MLKTSSRLILSHFPATSECPAPMVCDSSREVRGGNMLKSGSGLVITQNILTSFFPHFNVPIIQDRSGIWLRFRLDVTKPVCIDVTSSLPLFRCYRLVLTAWWSGLSLRVWNKPKVNPPILVWSDSWILIVQAWLPTLHWLMLSLHSLLASMLPRVGGMRPPSAICIGGTEARLILVRMMMLMWLIVHFAQN